MHVCFSIKNKICNKKNKGFKEKKEKKKENMCNEKKGYGEKPTPERSVDRAELQNETGP